MGSLQSTFNNEFVISFVVLSIGAVIFFSSTSGSDAESTARPVTGGKHSKKGKKSKAGAKEKERERPVVAPAVAPSAVSEPRAQAIPGGMQESPAKGEESEPSEKKSEKPKKRKTKSAKAQASPAPVTSLLAPPPSTVTTNPGTDAPPSYAESTNTEDEDGWMRTSRLSNSKGRLSGSATPVLSKSASKVSVGGAAPSSSKVTESESKPDEKRQTLAEKLLPVPAKTDVDDMLEDTSSVARVMRVVPAAGFSLGDYEDADELGVEQDDDDEGGWGIVQSRSKRTARSGGDSPPTSSQQTLRPKDPDTLTKKQRQNAARRDAQKAAKADAETERLAALAKHKRELERTRMAEQAKAGGSSAKISGGMKATVDENGKLVWE
ncbi:hypothetical protein BOTBODRAFT_34938 [Botryobasidium botryosum FD-172 SS1]|uniref:Uncharacterized protein n=1 Tax=Botryobasidium botryosum (strain FD-172 SS1) TaxID=930990 RepID=A0A067MJ25_BOTB1|nr:hypothetical protein BOTBODRAFT_34938 [Botryobasidium botryosum FD-172 SS1]